MYETYFSGNQLSVTVANIGNKHDKMKESESVKKKTMSIKH